MSKFTNIIAALAIFMSGVLFAYISWPFFVTLIDALDDASSAFADWEYIKGIAWIGLIGMYIIWIIVAPYYLAIVKEDSG